MKQLALLPLLASTTLAAGPAALAPAPIVSLALFKNGTTPYHDRIVSLVTEAMPRIKAYTKRPIKQTA